MIVRAPASSANLGPGFDCVGVALDLWNELELTDGDGVTVEGVGEDELPDDDTNLGVKAYALFGNPGGKQFRFVNRIPLERGLGSSAAAIAMGLAASAPERPVEELLAAGLRLESHGDNLAAALVGGVTLTWDRQVTRIADDLPLTPVAVVPTGRVRTALSRHALPATVEHRDATFSVGRATMLGAAIAAGDPELFAAALDDRLHEPYRPSPILHDLRVRPPGGARGATLSGSGPTVMVWADDPDRCADELRERFSKCEVWPLAVSQTGALG